MHQINRFHILGFPGDSEGKESAWSVGYQCSVPGLGKPPGGGHGDPHQYSSLENPHGQRSLVGYSPWSRKESHMTEQYVYILNICNPVCQVLLNFLKKYMFAFQEPESKYAWISFIISQDQGEETIWASNSDSICYISYFAKHFLHVISHNVRD